MTTTTIRARDLKPGMTLVRASVLDGHPFTLRVISATIAAPAPWQVGDPMKIVVEGGIVLRDFRATDCVEVATDSIEALNEQADYEIFVARFN